LHVGDLLAGDQDVRFVEYGLHPLLVRHEVRGDVTLVEVHPLEELELHVEGLPFLHVHHAVLADHLHCVGDDAPDLPGARAYGANADHAVPAFDLRGLLADSFDGDLGGLLDPAPQDDRVRAGRYVLDALVDDRLRQDERRRRPVARYVVGLCRNLLDHLRGLVLEDVLEINLLRDGHAIVGDGW
jgi:hypothetical protein